MHSEELLNLFFSLNIIMRFAVVLILMRVVQHVERISINTYK
jgi:hypothetical protein